MGRAIAVLTVVAAVASLAPAQMILNEANPVGSGKWLETGGASKPYEGFDYGVIPHSGLLTDPTAPNGGNPFSDVDASTQGVQSTLPNGWDGTTGFARILGNGGDWVELAITEDHADIRGWTLYWENDDDTGAAGVGMSNDERGYVRFSNDPLFADLRAGTILTITESSFADEIRDDYPTGLAKQGSRDTGHDYDLSTQTQWNPAVGDWHMNIHLDEDQTGDIDNPANDTQWFAAGSDLKVDNDDWQLWIFQAGWTVPSEGSRPDPNDPMLIQSPIGEADFNWGLNTGAGGVGSEECITLIADPVSGLTSADYEDTDFSTFGLANLYNDATESTLDGVQDFSALRAWWASIPEGDANLDGMVTDADYTLWADNFGAAGASWTDGDFNGDGTVTDADYTIWADNFGAGVPTPEPAGLGLLTLAGAALLRRRR